MADLRRGRIEDLEYLLKIGARVLRDLVLAERRSSNVAAGGVADHGGEIADQENHRVPEILKVLQLAEQHGMAKMQVGRSGIKAGINAQRLAGGARLFQTLAQLGFADDLDRALLDVLKLLVNRPELWHMRRL